MNIVFLSIVLILAITSLFAKKSINALISFALMMLVLGFYYISLDEKLLGLFQIFVYTGGIGVLMLFGITLIGVNFPTTKRNPWTALISFLVFIFMSALFLSNSSLLITHTQKVVEANSLFASSYSEVVILFALIASSLLYGTIKMINTLKRRKDV